VKLSPAWDAAPALYGLVSWIEMTKVTLHYDLPRPLAGEELDRIADIHATYGIVRVQVAPSLDKLTVDYDASRLMKKDVEAVLHRFGFPIRVAAAA
jgi:hypothetical protein